MALYPAAMQFRTTLDQAGRIAGLAGELSISEAEVMRRLLDRAMDSMTSRELLRSLRDEVRRELLTDALEDAREAGQVDAVDEIERQLREVSK